MTKAKSTKRALLMSALALLLCVSMLVGSTYAWFTDSVTSAGSRIQSGDLQVALLDENGVSLEGRMIGWAAYDGRAQDNILWEPGCTYNTVPFTVKNEGNLALEFSILVSGITGNAKLLEVIDFTCIAKNVTYTVNYGGFDIITTGDVDLLDGGKYVLEPGQAFEDIVLTGHMREDAGNEYKNLSIEDISITVIANQVPFEQDSFDGTYDENADVVSVTPETVQAALNNAADYTVIQLTAGNYGTLNLAPSLGGETTVLDTTTGRLSRAVNGLVIKGADGVTVDAIRVAPSGVGNTISLNNIVIDGVKFTGAADGFTCNDGNATIKNFVMVNCEMYDDGDSNLVLIKSGTPENITVTNCKVEGAARLITMTPSKNVTITNNTISNITTHGIHLDNSGGRLHSGIILIDNNYCYGAMGRFIRFANMDNAQVIVTNNRVHQYKGGLDANPYEDDYIKITYASDSAVPNVVIYNNEVNDADGPGWPARGDLFIKVKDDRYVQPY